MKFTVAALLSVLTTAFAQNARISFPTNGTSVTPGSNMTVQVAQANDLTSYTEVAVAIGILACDPTTSCISPSRGLGTVLYNGLFHPQLSSPGPPHQNFTVTIPPSLAPGSAQLSLLHVLLNGALNAPLSETPAPVILTVV